MARIHLKWSFRQQIEILELPKHFSAYLGLGKK